MTAGAAEPAWLVPARGASRFVLTLCSDVEIDALLAAAREELTVTPLDIAFPGPGACHLEFDSRPRDAWDLCLRLRGAWDDADIYLQPRNEFGKRLLICDMDMTIVAAETLDEVAASLGLGDRIAAITKRAMLGEIDFKAALRERIAMLAGRPEQVFHDVASRLELNPGAETLIKGAHEAGVHTILVSGGFEQVARPVAQRLGFDEVHCNRLEIDAGKLTGRVPEPIVDANLKRLILKRRALALGIPLVRSCAIGDGANDLPMLAASGLGIAYRGKPVLRESIPCRIDHTGLDSALYFMGLESPG